MNDDILSKMAGNEYLINELYITYANNFPNLVDFWSHLSKEEIHHQSMVLLFQEKVKSGEVFLEKDRFKEEAVKYFGEYLVKKINEAKTNKQTAIDALVTAVDLEKSLLESKVFTIFEADHAELKTLLSTLEKETKEHLAEVKEELVFIEGKQKQLVK